MEIKQLKTTLGSKIFRVFLFILSWWPQYILLHIQLICFFHVSIVQCLEILHKHNGYGFIYENPVLNWHIFTPSTYKKMLLPLYWRLKKIFFLDIVKSIEYLVLAVSIISYWWTSVYIKNVTVIPNSPFIESNPVIKPLYSCNIFS